MLKTFCAILIFSVLFNICGCSNISNKNQNESDVSTNVYIIENSSSKNNNTSYNSSSSKSDTSYDSSSSKSNTSLVSSSNPQTSSKQKISSTLNADSSIDLYKLKKPSTKKGSEPLSKDEVYGIISERFELDLPKNIKFYSGHFDYFYDKEAFQWYDEDEFPIHFIYALAKLNSNDFKNLLNQLNETWEMGEPPLMPHNTHDYEYIKTVTLQKKYKNTLIAEKERVNCICISKIGDDEYFARFDGAFYNSEFKEGTLEIQEDGSAKTRGQGQAEYILEKAEKTKDGDELK